MATTPADAAQFPPVTTSPWPSSGAGKNRPRGPRRAPQPVPGTETGTGNLPRPTRGIVVSAVVILPKNIPSDRLLALCGGGRCPAPHWERLLRVPTTAA